MLRGRGIVAGFDTVVFGLSRINIERLQAGQPILFAGEEIGLDCNVLIIAGETEDALAATLESGEHLGEPQTETLDEEASTALYRGTRARGEN